MHIRKALCLLAALFAVAVHSPTPAQSQYTYYGYLAGTSTSSSGSFGYFLMDVQNGPTRQVYFDAKNYVTGDYYKTNNPAGSQIVTAQTSPDHLYYAGSMYSGKKLVGFELTVCRDAGSACGFAVRFQLRDKKTGKLLVDRYDLLDETARVYGCS